MSHSVVGSASRITSPESPPYIVGGPPVSWWNRGVEWVVQGGIVVDDGRIVSEVTEGARVEEVAYCSSSATLHVHDVIFKKELQ